jgi:uncharacterized iron-regulated membrane protein
MGLLKKLHAPSVPARWRPKLASLHLMLGLVLGANVVFLGITGSVLVFQKNVNRWLDPEIHAVGSSGHALSPSRWLVRLRERFPNLHGAWQFHYPHETQDPVTGVYVGDDPGSHSGASPQMVWINTMTNTIVKERRWGETIMTWIYDAHFTLRFAQPGMVAVAMIGMAMLTMLVTGLVLWWPVAGQWRRAFEIRTTSNRRLFYDLHRVLGACGSVLLVVLVTTGILLNLPTYLEPIVETLSPGSIRPAASSAQGPDQQSLLPDAVVELVERNFPASHIRVLTTPEDRTGTYSVTILERGQPDRSNAWTTVLIDQYSGNILASQRPLTRSVGAGFLSWLLPLHNGEAFGTVGRLVVFVLGCLPAVLYGTGVYLWWRRRKGRSRIVSGS